MLGEMVAHEAGSQQATGLKLQQLLLELEKLGGDWGIWETFVFWLWLPLSANSSLHKLPQSTSRLPSNSVLNFSFAVVRERRQ